MPKKSIQDLATERGFDPAEVRDELQSRGHDVKTVKSQIEEEDAVRVLDVGVRLVVFEHDGQFVGAVYTKMSTDLGAYDYAKKFAPEHTHAMVYQAGAPWEAYDKAPRDQHDKLLDEKDLEKLREGESERREQREQRERDSRYERPDWHRMRGLLG